MVMEEDSQIFESYVPVFDVVPENWEEARQFLVEQLKKVSNAINIREIGWWLDEELISGKQFFPSGASDPPQFRTILRKVIDFGALPDTAMKSVAHGITFDANFSLIQMFASATDPTNFIALPIPFASGVLVESVKMDMDATNVNITTYQTRSSFTRCYVTIEYIQEI